MTMKLVLPFLLLGTACTSPTSKPKIDVEPTQDECVNGTYQVTFSAEKSGAAICPDLSTSPMTWTFAVNPNGSVGVPVPEGSYIDSVSEDDACELGYTTVESNSCGGLYYDFKLRFVSGQTFSGSYTIVGCSPPLNQDQAPENVDCIYAVTGTH